MLRTDLLCRPFSYDRPKQEGYEPQIYGRIARVSRSKRNAWRSTVYVDACPMATSHHDTKSAAENATARMIDAYAKVHYVQV